MDLHPSIYQRVKKIHGAPSPFPIRHEEMLSCRTSGNVVELVSSLGKWCATEKGINLAQQRGMAQVLVTGRDPDGVAVTRRMEMHFLRGLRAPPLPCLAPQCYNHWSFGGLLGYWRTFIPRFVISLCLLQQLTGKKVVRQGTKRQQEAFDGCKNALIEHAQLHSPEQGYPFELEGTIPDNTVSGSWRRTGVENQKEPVGRWSEAFHGSPTHHNPTSPLTLHPLGVPDSRVLVFRVSSTSPCALSRGDGIGTVLLASPARHPIEVQPGKAQGTAPQSVRAIPPRVRSSNPWP